MKHLPKPKPYRPYETVFVEYVKSAVPGELDISEEVIIKITDDLKNIYRESQKDKK
ncbi:hypothetical protein HWC53_gp076 [Bacillus phage vB_BmeM-Goe8]|uniref:Uncharacterized protein n=1 Tax=Bacillus phage vB_BmeM-Goe8 TaxID=2593638 RepID=A0A516KMI6_9CAUD|nr:hypothetical protein HWC53_gp002 [Bacillus phage vB_BmeM-Goe8]YP_009850174.1 hypothetical protein HWC53_gp076 [Bacillus phage vB_BmeM-Goe8]QDP42786.1 hypothetical protein Goe8_c00020 [Bacillus phage vB_BmeM-Goe8]QDP43013.1 hypothetical protein Goe8_c02400 [Bacillus phage vB_BmeM-Goe8]